MPLFLIKKMSVQWLALSIASFIGILLTIFLARELEVEKFGQYGLILSFGAIFTILIDLGYRNIIVLGSIKEKKSSGQVLLFVSAIRSFVLSLLLIPLIFLFFNSFVLSISIGLIFFMTNLISNTSFFLKAINSVYKDALFIVVNKSLTLAFIVTTVLYYSSDIYLILLSWFAALFISLILFNPVKLINSKITSKEYLLFPKNFMYFYLIDIFTFLYYRSDLLLMKLLGTSMHEIGNYTASFKFIEGFVILQTPLSIMLLRFLINPSSSVIRHKKFVILLSTFFVISLSLVIHFYAEDISLIFYGDKYDNSGKYLSILSISLIFIFINMFFIQYCLSRDLIVQYFYATLIAAIFNTMLNYFYIPLYGALASSYVTVITEVIFLIFLVTFILCRKKIIKSL
jgi:O-antigen/teichoic acid export membrane protein